MLLFAIYSFIYLNNLLLSNFEYYLKYIFLVVLKLIKKHLNNENSIYFL